MSIQEQSQNAWDQIATGYDEFVTPKNLALAEIALDIVGLRSGMQFLDVAAGSGALSIPAARLGAQVVAVDSSPMMVEQLNARAHKEGLSNLKAYVMDGCSLSLEDSIFDICGSQHGVSLFPNLPQGLRELVRVMKPGGNVLIVAFGPLKKAEFLSLFMQAMQTTLPNFTSPQMEPAPLPFQVADPEKLCRQMTDAGLTDVRVETVIQNIEIETGQALWDMVTNSNPIGATLVADLEPTQKTSIQKTLERLLQERRKERGAVILNEINIGIGIKG
jgi:ubiquinone/menaquinone biosynthesis C-methylase UbiE